MKLKKLLAVMLVLAMTVSMLTACGTKEKDTNPDTQTSEDTNTNTDTETPEDTSTDSDTKEAVGTSAYPGTLDPNSITVNIATEPAEMNTITTTDTVSFSVIRHIIENLVTLDDNDRVQPGVAKEWTVSDDGLVYTFKLRDDMKWTNGEPVTANDFVFAWTSLLTPEFAADYAGFGYVFKNGRAYNNGEVGADQLGFKALDPYTLECTLENPTPYFIDTLAFGVLAPMNEKAYKEFGTAYATDADKIVTNGPFTMTSWEHESKIVLTKNPDHYNAKNIELETINMVMINDSNAALNAFRAGEVDMVGVNGDQSKMMQGEGYPVHTYDDGATFYLEFNLTDPTLANQNLRTAIMYAIDRQAFIDSIVKNSSKAAMGFTPPVLKGVEKQFVEEVGNTLPAFDKAKATEYYEKAKAELGTNDIKITMISDDGDTAVKNAAFIQEQLKVNLGLEIVVESMPFKSRIERMSNKDFSLVFAGWGPDYNDPMTFLDLFETGNGNNHTSYSNPAYDELLAKVRVTVDAKERMGYLMELEKMVTTELPIVPVYWRARDYVVSGKIASGVLRTAFQDMKYTNVKLTK